MLNCEFNSGDRLEWIKNIAEYRKIVKNSNVKLINILLGKNAFDNENEELKPYHIVSLACFIEECYKLGKKVKLDVSTKSVFFYL